MGLGPELHLLPVPQPGQVRLVGLQLHPHLRQVGNRVDRTAGLDVHAFLGVLVDHHAADGGVNCHMVDDLAALFDRLDLLGLEAPETELLLRSLHGRLRGLAHQAALAVLQLLDGMEDLEQFFLRLQELGAVQVDQVIALVDRHAGVVHVKPVQPAGDPGRDDLHKRLVVVDLADHPDLGFDELPLDRRGLDGLKLRRGRIDRHLAKAAHLLALHLHRNQVHQADRALARPGQIDLWMHGATPLDSALARVGLGLLVALVIGILASEAPAQRKTDHETRNRNRRHKQPPHDTRQVVGFFAHVRTHCLSF